MDLVRLRHPLRSARHRYGARKRKMIPNNEFAWSVYGSGNVHRITLGHDYNVTWSDQRISFFLSELEIVDLENGGPKVSFFLQRCVLEHRGFTWAHLRLRVID